MSYVSFQSQKSHLFVSVATISSAPGALQTGGQTDSIFNYQHGEMLLEKGGEKIKG